MAGRRVERLSHAIRDIVSDVMCKELSDPRISPFASITRVDVSGDLQEARVHISVLGSEVDGTKTLAGLRHATGRIQRLMAGRLTVRRCPHLRFELDDSIKRAAAVVRLIDETVASDQADAARREAAERDSEELPGGDAGSLRSDRGAAEGVSSQGTGAHTESSAEIDDRERRLNE